MSQYKIMCMILSNFIFLSKYGDKFILEDCIG